MTRTWTKRILVALTLAVIAWDVVALVVGGSDATISRVVFGWSRENPVIPFALGFVLGHLVWPQPKEA